MSIINIVYRILLIIAMILVVVIVFFTILAFIRTPAANSQQVSIDVPVSGNFFDRIGQLRIITADEKLLILSISFPYPPNDQAFFEELVKKTDDFRNIARNYFTILRSDEIEKTDESIIKNALIENFNSILRLGKLQTLYFNDFIILF